MIKFFHVYKAYETGSFTLADAHFAVDDGEMVFLVGPSGAGKTTLLKLVSMEEFPTKGQVVVGRFTSSGMTRRKVPFLRREVGVIFQDFRLLRDRTVYENVAMSRRVMGFGDDLTTKFRVLRALDEVNLAGKAQAFPDELSGGEQQRVAIARAVLNRPAVLLADEPTGNLDEAVGDEIIAILRRMCMHGTSVIMATHKKELVTKHDVRRLSIEGGLVIDHQPREVAL